jgi:hypothetical protein
LTIAGPAYDYSQGTQEFMQEFRQNWPYFRLGGRPPAACIIFGADFLQTPEATLIQKAV